MRERGSCHRPSANVSAPGHKSYSNKGRYPSAMFRNERDAHPLTPINATRLAARQGTRPPLAHHNPLQHDNEPPVDPPTGMKHAICIMGARPSATESWSKYWPVNASPPNNHPTTNPPVDLTPV